MQKVIMGIAAAAVMTACGGEMKDKATDVVEEVQEEVVEVADEVMGKMKSYQAGPYTLTEASDHHDFGTPQLSLNAPIGHNAKAGMNQFEFEVEGESYELGSQTPDAGTIGCANSAKGQHIHFIVNNKPYKAHYTNSFEGELEDGDNVVLAFLSRSYHESLKNKGAAVVQQYNFSDQPSVDLNAKHLFYSRPKGTYTGEFAQKIILDFYPLNTELSAEGDKVRVTINGEHSADLDKWAPYTIEGLPMGKNTIEIQLIDAEGNLIDGPFNNSGAREITLEEAPEGDA